MTDRENLTALLMAGSGDCLGKDGTLNCSKFADYLLEHGVIVLPCKVGDILYCESAIKGHITHLKAPDLEWIVENRELFGKEIFFSGEEAEKALNGREQNEGFNNNINM